MSDQQNYQLKLTDAEMRRLGARVNEDYRAALSDHQRRINRCAEYLRRWRARTDMPEAGDEEKSNYPVPFVRWNIFNKWAKEMDSIFGDDAEIVAVPVGPSDFRKVQKISTYMTWRVFNSMKLTLAFCEFVVKKLIYGRAHAYAPWKKVSFDVPTNGGMEEVVDYEGPEFLPLEPDDLIVPAEDAKTVHDFSFVIRKYRATPQQLLIGEEDGRYQGIVKNFETICATAYKRIQREPQGDEVKFEQDEAEGVERQGALSTPSTLLILEWYGKWRMLKKASADADEFDIKKRQLHESDLVIRFCPDLQMVVGAQDLMQLYPTMRLRRPFVESSLVKDGSYWSPGFAEMLIDMEDEVRNVHNQGTDSFDRSVGPLIFYRPGSGFESERFKYEAGMCLPVDNPATDVRVVELPCNLTAAQETTLALFADGERLTGLSDMTTGRQPDRPNSPKTARGTVALIEEGNVRMSLDATVLRQDMAEILRHFWQLEYMFSPEQTFFRVTEDDADGLFPTKDGGAMITREDRDGRYDFRLEFAGTQWSREAEKERTLARYQIDLNNPLIVNNPAALWEVTRQVHEALGDPNFANLVPRPPTPDQPVDPKEEWNRLLQGETIKVNPMDNDELHLMRHSQDLQNAQSDPERDPDAFQKMQVHYIEQFHQLQEKKVVQAIIEKALQRAQQMTPGNPLAGAGLPPQMQQLAQRPQPPQPAGQPQPGGPPQ